MTIALRDTVLHLFGPAPVGRRAHRAGKNPTGKATPVYLGSLPAGPVRFDPSLRRAGEMAKAAEAAPTFQEASK